MSIHAEWPVAEADHQYLLVAAAAAAAAVAVSENFTHRHTSRMYPAPAALTCTDCW